MIFNLFRQALNTCLLLLVLVAHNTVNAHGGVVLEDDLCNINIGFLTAHFTVYQPQTRDSKEFCEDIPDISGSVFVMEYLHEFLRQMPVDFRIIRDVNDVGPFAKWEDIIAIDDLEAATVFYQSPRIQGDGNYTVEYTFQEKGTYIGIVTARRPDEDRFYNAVFYFQVGGPELGTIPIFIGLLIILQLGYWLANGGVEKLRNKELVKA